MNHLKESTKSEAFLDRLLGIYSASTTAMMISVGHRTGLFDTLAGTEAVTSHDLALRAELDERYVREWLGAMVTARIVDYDPRHATYVLPPEHAGFLTRKSSPTNLAVSAQFISVLAGVEDEIVECFRKGGGVPYAKYPRFHEVMAEESAQTVVAALDPFILPIVPGLVTRLEAGISVLDVGCGRGKAMLKLAERFPNSQFSGYDFSVSAIQSANENAKNRKLWNARFEVRDAARMTEVKEDWERFDLVTAFDAIHDQVEPDKMLSGIAAVLKKDGTFLAQDIKGSSVLENNLENPLASFLFAMSCMHCMTVSLSAGGAGLGAMWGKEKALEMFKQAGFGSVRVIELPHDLMNYYYVAKK